MWVDDLTGESETGYQNLDSAGSYKQIPDPGSQPPSPAQPSKTEQSPGGDLILHWNLCPLAHTHPSFLWY
jgi:hypothetical protein